jgi:hypothetical protein
MRYFLDRGFSRLVTSVNFTISGLLALVFLPSHFFYFTDFLPVTGYPVLICFSSITGRDGVPVISLLCKLEISLARQLDPTNHRFSFPDSSSTR